MRVLPGNRLGGDIVELSQLWAFSVAVRRYFLGVWVGFFQVWGELEGRYGGGGGLHLGG